MSKYVYIRRELNNTEYRTPLTPISVSILIANGIIVYVQSSDTRIYKDEEYKDKGAIITTLEWWDNKFKNACIIGLKDINLIHLNNHTHVYFSHSYKQQYGSQQILSRFKHTGSMLYDLEYFMNNENKRLISFGYYAGIAGCLLGLLQYYTKTTTNKNINNLHYINSPNDMLQCIAVNKFAFNSIKIAVVGHKGNCGSGVLNILNTLDINYTCFNKNSYKTELINYDIIFNCISLHTDYNTVWFNTETIFNKPLLIVDISCDYTKHNNPIQLYNNPTTWENPVFSYNSFVDIIAINNLPNLLPKDSSDHFSVKCCQLLLAKYNPIINSVYYNSWNKNRQIFFTASQSC